MTKLSIPLAFALIAPAATVQVLTTSGKVVEGTTGRKKVSINGRDIAVDKILSIHNGADASSHEVERIQAGLTVIPGKDRAVRDKAVEELTAIGIPVITPLLKAYKDTDAHEPNPLYRLFGRIMPAHSDQLDRTASTIRLADGSSLRGKLDAEAWTVNGAAIPAAEVRRVAVKQKLVRRKTEVHSLRHCNQIEFLDTGIIATAESKVESAASGFVRLSWNTDDWTSDPDGLKKPAGNYKTNLVNGHPFGALTGRLGAAGQMFFMGRNFRKAGIGAGPLNLSINDNPHWQNNLGSFRVTLSATSAYDVGDAQ